VAVTVPDEFVEALLLLMPDAEFGPSAGETVYFPCYDTEALDFGNRLFFLEPGCMPRLEFELEVRIPAGAVCARGTLRGPDPPGGVAVGEPRLWLADSRAFEIVRERRRATDLAGTDA
jgi:hypothetical protein